MYKTFEGFDGLYKIYNSGCIVQLELDEDGNLTNNQKVHFHSFSIQNEQDRKKIESLILRMNLDGVYFNTTSQRSN